ncbi:MAG: hypothetical protein K1W34_18015 [Lachnospiraceae bacterium]
MKVYGADICIDCRNFKHIRKLRGLNLEFIDITADTASLKEFLMIRDKGDIFKSCREEGGIGIPCFVEGNRMTLDIDEAFSWIGQPPVRKEEILESRD